MEKIELVGGACFSHGPYTFYKAVKINNSGLLRLGSFFLTKLWNDADLVSIGELQLLWLDNRGPNTPFASLRLYFLPENTPDGRRDTHGEDEVLTISEKVVVRVHDLVTWLSPSLEWSWGREVKHSCRPPSPADLRVETDASDFDFQQEPKPKVVVLSYARYCRYRALLRRVEGSESEYLNSPAALAMGGLPRDADLKGTRVLFCRDTFDYPDLETHELLCNHLAPKLKGRPRRKRRKRSLSPGDSSNESEASEASSKASNSVKPFEKSSVSKEKNFIKDVTSFMNSYGTPLGKMPLLGYRQIDLYLFYNKVQQYGGYDYISAKKLWKAIYVELGGHANSTSAATITRKHYERLLLPYERCQRGDAVKMKRRHARLLKVKCFSKASVREERDQESSSPSTTPPPYDIIKRTSPSSLSCSLILNGSDKSKLESGKISSLRSVRVKPERLKSINTVISGNQVNNYLSDTTTPTSITLTSSQNVLEKQENSCLTSQQQVVCSVSETNASMLLSLTQSPDKEIKEIKLGKENIPVEDKILGITESPEVIDLENESEISSNREKIIIPTLKKRKLEILREGGLEVTPVDFDSRGVSHTFRDEEKPVFSVPSGGGQITPKLISVTVTPDITHMLPRSNEKPSFDSRSQSPPFLNNSGSPKHGNKSRVINLGSSNDTKLLQLYANASNKLTPPKVTQSRSIFMHNEGVVYGNPKEILCTSKIGSHTTGVLDLTQKSMEKSSFCRPNLEIVKVPVVQRRNPFFIEARNSAGSSCSSRSSSGSSIGNINNSPIKDKTIHPLVLDSKTIANNNLEITLVSPKKGASLNTSQNSPLKNNMSISPSPRKHQTNGKLTSRIDPVSSYSPHKPHSHQVIPNIPNLNYMNNPKQQHQQISGKESLSRRHSTTNVAPRYVSPPQSNNSLFEQISHNAGKFLPMLDPMYYSAFYNGLFPTTGPFFPAELSAYYKDLLASSQSRLTSSGKHQPPVPTSK